MASLVACYGSTHLELEELISDKSDNQAGLAYCRIPQQHQLEMTNSIGSHFNSWATPPATDIQRKEREICLVGEEW